MKLCVVLVFLNAALNVCKCDIGQAGVNEDLAAQHYALKCKYVNETGPYEEAFLENDYLYPAPTDLAKLKKKSRVCLPWPCDKLLAYSGYIPVDDEKSSYLFFLHIKAKAEKVGDGIAAHCLNLSNGTKLISSICAVAAAAYDTRTLTGRAMICSLMKEKSKDNVNRVERIPIMLYGRCRQSTVNQGNMQKPLLLWLQGGPGKSSLFGEFLENGPLGIDAQGDLYYREHTLLNLFNIIYLDQPVGSGYSFTKNGKYPSSLEEASNHTIRFLEGFLKIFQEYKDRDFYIAGEPYGARFTVGVAHQFKNHDISLKLKGVMLGVGFLFPLLDIINSTDFLYYSRLLDNCSSHFFAERFDTIKTLSSKKASVFNATLLLSQTVLNLRQPGQKSLFEKLTGFMHHGSITVPQRPVEVLRYYHYANSSRFKRIIHVAENRTLDGTRYNITMQLALHDFFEDHKHALLHVLNNLRVLFYTAQHDDVFPAVNIDRSFMDLEWRGSEEFKRATRKHWHRENNSSLDILGYLKRVGTLLHANVLFGGHYIFLERSFAVSQLYSHFLKVMSEPPEQPSPGEIPSC